MSRRAELLLLCLRYLKKRQARETVPIPAIRRRLKLIERIVPLPPAGTRTQVIDADGIRAVHITVPQSHSDRYLLYFHGGGHVVGSAPLYRDFLWRIAVAARACVLYFDYRLDRRPLVAIFHNRKFSRAMPTRLVSRGQNSSPARIGDRHRCCVRSFVHANDFATHSIIPTESQKQGIRIKLSGRRTCTSGTLGRRSCSRDVTP
jgi:alpha/beta hydrolase fold